MKGKVLKFRARHPETGRSQLVSQYLGVLTDDQMQQLVQLMVMGMSPDQIQMLAQAMPQIVALNQQFHAQQGGGAGEADPSNQAGPSNQAEPKIEAHPIPNMDAESQKRIQMAAYESIKLSQDTRWAQMIKKVG